MLLDDQEIRDKSDSQSITSVDWLFHYSGIAFLFAAFLAYLSFKNLRVDVQIRDTYFVFSYFTIFAILSIYFYTTGSLYNYVNRSLKLKTSTRLGWLHFLLTTIAVLTIGIAIIFIAPNGLSQRYQQTSASFSSADTAVFDTTMLVALGLFVGSQLLLLHLFYYEKK